MTDARNNPTVYTYDNMDRLTTRQDPLLTLFIIPTAYTLLARRRTPETAP